MADPILEQASNSINMNLILIKERNTDKESQKDFCDLL